MGLTQLREDPQLIQRPGEGWKSVRMHKQRTTKCPEALGSFSVGGDATRQVGYGKVARGPEGQQK